MVSDLLEMHLASSANRLNEIMKTLTMISTVILPMTLIAGIYGMNFENMAMFPPVNAAGHWLCYAVMMLAGLLPMLVFKWKKWI
jgi:magnesium transporter